MKAFHFKLDSALRWRLTQLQLAREAVARATAHLATVRENMATLQAALDSGARDVASGGTGAFASWGAYADRCRRRIALLQRQLTDAQTALASHTGKMLDAHRKVRVLENLRTGARTEWTRELNGETEAFASEVFLARLQSKGGRARSSSG